MTATGCAIARFYLECVAAEDGEALKRPVGSDACLRIHPTPFAFQSPCALRPASETDAWCAKLGADERKSLVMGWPVCVGEDEDLDSRALCVSPLLITDVRLRRENGSWVCERLGVGIDLNVSALSLLGLDLDERRSIENAVVKSIRIKETKGMEERVDAMLEVLQGMGVPGLEDLDRSSPVPSLGRTGIQNVALVLRSGNPSRMSRNLVRELGELAASSSLMSAGPAAVLVGGTTGEFVESVKPQPTVVHSSLRQDQAVHAAMENVLTVVTGPPGTGKSQVLVNAVAAAVTRGESVLLASKNNKAVDVVVQRLGAVSPHAVVIRTGAASKRREVAEKIARLVGESRKPGRPPQVVEAHAAWLSESRTLQKIYEVLDDRRRLADELSGLNRELTEHLRAGSTLEGPNVDPKELGKAADQVLTTLERFGDSLGWFWRGRKHERRLEDARRALDAFAALSGLRRSEVGRCLSGLADGPTRSRAAVDAFGKL